MPQGSWGIAQNKPQLEARAPPLPCDLPAAAVSGAPGTPDEERRHGLAAHEISTCLPRTFHQICSLHSHLLLPPSGGPACRSSHRPVLQGHSSLAFKYVHLLGQNDASFKMYTWRLLVSEEEMLVSFGARQFLMGAVDDCYFKKEKR